MCLLEASDHAEQAFVEGCGGEVRQFADQRDAGGPLDDREHITEEARYYMAGIVRRLNRASEEARERDAAFALTLANAAVVIAQLLPMSQYDAEERASLRGHAWRERANALRYGGDYPAALSAFERAGAEFRATRAPDFDLARIDFGLATVLWKMERFSEALPVARQARAQFAA